MATITITCPEQVLVSLKEEPNEFARDLTLTAAMKFYELGRLSSGRAAELAGVSRVAFLHRAAQFRVPVIDESKEDLEADERNA